MSKGCMQLDSIYKIVINNDFQELGMGGGGAGWYSYKEVAQRSLVME